MTALYRLVGGEPGQPNDQVGLRLAAAAQHISIPNEGQGWLVIGDRAVDQLDLTGSTVALPALVLDGYTMIFESIKNGFACGRGEAVELLYFDNKSHC